jgi:hypothetical protein
MCLAADKELQKLQRRPSSFSNNPKSALQKVNDFQIENFFIGSFAFS